MNLSFLVLAVSDESYCAPYLTESHLFSEPGLPVGIAFSLSMAGE